MWQRNLSRSRSVYCLPCRKDGDDRWAKIKKELRYCSVLLSGTLKCNFPPLQERWRHLRLTSFYRIVEGSIPALPPEKFLKQQKPGRQIRMWQLDGKSDNPVNKYSRHNDRPYVVTHCNTKERKNSFFPRTTVDWNQPAYKREDLKQKSVLPTESEKILKYWGLKMWKCVILSFFLHFQS